LLSNSSSTCAWSDAARVSEPANRTSSGFSARSSCGESDPAAQTIASDTFDFPEPFGPTITPTPGSRRISTGSGNDLKPRILIAVRCTGAEASAGCGWRNRRSGRESPPARVVEVDVPGGRSSGAAAGPETQALHRSLLG